MIRKTISKHALLLLTLGTSLLYLLGLSRAPLLKDLNETTSDMLYRARASALPPAEFLDQMVVIGVDDESYARMNRPWPWPRDIYALFFENLHKMKPRATCFDFTLVGKSPDPKSDAWLAQAIADSGNVVLASYVGPDGIYVTPQQAFQHGAAGLGFVDKFLDHDGIHRRFRPVRYNASGKMFSSLPVKTYSKFLGLLPEQWIHSDHDAIRLMYPGESPSQPEREVVLPLRSDGSARLAYRYRSAQFHYISIWRVILGEVQPDEVRDKIVMVGPTSPVFHDVHNTPLGMMQGIFSHANEAMAIAGADFIREPLLGKEWWVYLIVSAIFTLILSRLSFTYQLAVFIGVNILIALICAALFIYRNILIEPFIPAAVLTLNFFVIGVYRSTKTFLDNIALQQQVITDSLTGLYGHRFLVLKLGSIFLHSTESKTEFCVAMVDVDHFKKVNDTHGHSVGNQVLVALARAMKHFIRRQDIAARFGGEEFTLVLIGTDAKGARDVVDRMRKTAEEMEFNSDKGKFKVTISGGIVSNQNPAVKNSEDMLKLADKALYEAKAQGRNRICVA